MSARVQHPDLPQRLLAFYGDDFTGASSVLESLALAGISTMLFLEAPTAADLADHPGLQAMGIAGVARARDPQWMHQNLPSIFRSLADFGAPLTHYKVCSTFDSSPTLGSIGTAAELGIPILGGAWHPLVVGAPEHRRYQVFGHLFAGLNNEVFRLDQHPIARNHPATPMDEADVRKHLGRQTQTPVGLIDLLALASGQGETALQTELDSGAEIVAIDIVDTEGLPEVGRLVWNNGEGPVFAIGSQGVEHALLAHWKATGQLSEPSAVEPASPVAQILAVSGSCSAVTAAQIDQAAADGFAIIDLDIASIGSSTGWQNTIDSLTRSVLDLLSGGRDVLVASASNTNQPKPTSDQAANDAIGQALGTIVKRARTELGIPRVVIAGGDTSGHAISTLGATALSVVAPLDPGVPLCRIHAKGSPVDGIEVALKGGQMGSGNFFSKAKG